MQAEKCPGCEKDFTTIQPEGRFECGACARELCFWCVRRNLYDTDYHVCKECFPKWTAEAAAKGLCEINEYGQQNWQIDDETRRRELEGWLKRL